MPTQLCLFGSAQEFDEPPAGSGFKVADRNKLPPESQRQDGGHSRSLLPH